MLVCTNLLDISLVDSVDYISEYRGGSYNFQNIFQNRTKKYTYGWLVFTQKIVLLLFSFE